MSEKLMIPCLYLLKGQAVTGWGQKNIFDSGDVEQLARFYSDHGADEILVFDFSTGDQEHEVAIGKIKEICAAAEVPVIGAGNVKRMEDVKKLLYAGCAKAVLNFSSRAILILSKRFPKNLEKIRL